MDGDQHQVVFLYKLIDGICEKSFGTNVATMAGVPDSIVKHAVKVSEEFEKKHQLKDSTYENNNETSTSSTTMDMELDNTLVKKNKFNITPGILEDFAYLLQQCEQKEDGAMDVNGNKKLHQTRVLKDIIKSFQLLQ